MTQEEKDREDERLCGERVNYWLEKFGCTMHGQCVIENGGLPTVRVGIMKLPPEVLKQIKDAKKGKTAQTPVPPHSPSQPEA